MARTCPRSAVFLAVCIAGATLSLMGGSRHVRAAGRATQPAGGMDGNSKLSTFEIFAGLWRTDKGFDSTLRVRNELLTTPIDVTPILYMADGTEYELPRARIAAGGVAVVDINRALATTRGVIGVHRSPFGSAALRYRYSTGGHVVGSIQMLNTAQSLIFVTSFNGVDATDVGLHTLEGLWWRHDARVGGYVSLANVTQDPEAVTVQPVDGRGVLGRVRRFTLSAHATEVHNLEEFVGAAATSAAGGLRVTYGGAMGGVVVTGGLVNEREGYSAGIPFYFHDTSAPTPVSINYGSAGLMTGGPDPLMGFPQGVVFTPYAALRNTTDAPLPIALSLAWMASDGTPITNDAPAMTLGARESRLVDMHALLADTGLTDFNGTLNLGVSFTGLPGDIVLATGSVDATGTFVFEVEPQGIGPTNSEQVAYWAAGPDGTDTMYSLWNPTDSAQDIVLTLIAGDGSGSYKLPLHLAPHGSTTIDVGALVQSQQPDADGRVIPRSVAQGSAIIDSAAGRRTGVTLVVSGGTFNVRTGTCGATCMNCCGYSFGVTPGDFVMAVGETMACAFRGTDCNGGTIDFAANWSSSDSSVISVDGSGNVSGVAAGSATINGQLAQPVTVYSGQICSGGTPSCPSGQPFAQTPGTAHRPTSLSVVSDQYLSPPPNGLLYDRHRVYQILDENGNAMSGYAPTGLNVSETYTPNPASGNCSNSRITTGGGYATGQGQFPDDYTVGGTPPNPCTSSSTQRHFVNGNQVSTYSVTWTRSAVTIQ